MIRTYTALLQYSSIQDRFRYLSLKGEVGRDTFGHERHLNQTFYHSREWRDIREEVIARDLGCDLGVMGYEIHTPPHIHHMNPMNARDILERDRTNLDPEYLITVSQKTHNAIHYGDERHLPRPLIERFAGDTVPWR